MIRERACKLVEEHALRLPQLDPLLEMEAGGEIWFPVPGMYGGFKVGLVGDGVDAKLVVENWCRVVEGSGQRHEITCRGSNLVEEGFV